jgi:hypothetical protein
VEEQEKAGGGGGGGGEEKEGGGGEEEKEEEEEEKEEKEEEKGEEKEKKEKKKKGRKKKVNFPYFISCDNMELSLTCLSLETNGCKHTTHSTEAGGNFPRSEVASPLGQLSHQDS